MFQFGTLDAKYRSKRNEKEEFIMKTTIARKTAYLGAGAGLVLFALFGLMPGSLLGGAMGINIAGWLFGLPLQPGILSRMIVLASMLMGVLVAGIVIVTATSSIGWLAGKVLESGVHAKEAAEAGKTAQK
jgi:small-conductance mechanosensitive channel